MGTFLGVPIVRTIVYWYIGVYIGVPLFWETTILIKKSYFLGHALNIVGDCKMLDMGWLETIDPHSGFPTC